MDYNTKICCTCHNEKPITEYNKDVGKKDGLTNRCRECNRRISSEWYRNNKAKATERRVKHYTENKELYRQYSENWAKKNPEKRKESREKWKHTNPKKNRAARIKYENKRRAWERNTDHRATTEQINELIKNSENVCFWCDQDIPKGKMHIDHIYPLARGGKDEIYNLVVSCESCNKAKGCKNPEEWIERICID